MEETAAYIRHRLKVAGTEKALFMPEAVSDVFSFSQGIPRLINILCDRSLVTAYTQDLKVVRPTMIEECARELEITSSAADSAITRVHQIETTAAVQENPDDHPAGSRPYRPKRGWISAALAVAAAAVFFMAVFLWPDKERTAQQKAEIKVPASSPRVALKADPKDSSPASRMKTPGARKSEIPAEGKNKTRTEKVSKPNIVDKENINKNELQASAPRDEVLQQEASSVIAAERQRLVEPSPVEKPPSAPVEAALKDVESKQRLFMVFFKTTSAELEDRSYETLRQVIDHLSAHTYSEITISAYPALDARPELSVKMAELRAISLKTVLATQPKFNGKIIVVNPDGPGSDQNRKSTAAEFSKPMAEIRVIRRTATAEQ
jgi:general secretion pathway protein A